jgi:flagellar motor component MotA
VCYQIKQLNFDEVKVYLTPVERFFEEKTENKRSVLNFSVELISYSRTLTTMEIEHWEKEFILELKKLDKEIKMR